MIQTLNKVDKILDEVDNKMKSMDSLFSIVDKINDLYAIINERVFSLVTTGISKLFEKKKEEK